MEGWQGGLVHGLARGSPKLHGAARPAALLLAIRFVIRGDLIRALDVVAPHEMPPFEEGAEREVHVFHQGACIPTTSRVDACFAPHAARAVEVEEVAGGEARILLTLDVRVEADLLVAAEERLVRVDVSPTPLHEAHVLVLEHRDASHQEILLREEVGVEDGDELARNIVVHLRRTHDTQAQPQRRMGGASQADAEVEGASVRQ